MSKKKKTSKRYDPTAILHTLLVVLGGITVIILMGIATTRLIEQSVYYSGISNTQQAQAASTILTLTSVSGKCSSEDSYTIHLLWKTNYNASGHAFNIVGQDITHSKALFNTYSLVSSVKGLYAFTFSETVTSTFAPKDTLAFRVYDKNNGVNTITSNIKTLTYVCHASTTQ